MGWAYAKIAKLLELDESSVAVRRALAGAEVVDFPQSHALARAVWQELERLGLGETALFELYAAMKSDKAASTGGRPTHRRVNAVLAQLVARAKDTLDEVEQSKAAQLVAMIQMLWGRQRRDDIITLDCWPGYALPPRLNGPKRLAALTDRVRRRVFGLTPS